MNAKESVLTLFDDNVVGAISAADMRIFVETVFDSKENEIHVFENLQDLYTYRQNPEYPILKFDLIVITDHQNLSQIKETGIYLSLKDNPGKEDVFKISNLNYDEFLKTGLPTQLISLDSDSNLVWIDQLDGYFIEGTDYIEEILKKRPDQRGEIWIAIDDNYMAPVPGVKGDGYSWNGTEWNNIGQLRGPAGDVTDVAFATQSEVNNGIIDDKSISPLTFENSRQLLNKENKLSFPTNSGDVLSSDTQGNKSWITPVKEFDDLNDVNLNNLQTNSFIYFNGNSWVPELLNNVMKQNFIDLDDTPLNYTNQSGKGLSVNSYENGLIFTDLVKYLPDLQDISQTAPTNAQILKFNASKGLWEPVDDINIGNSTDRPTNPRAGFQFFDLTLQRPIWYTGTKWVNSNGETI